MDYLARKSHSEWKISKEEFIKRFNENFYDPYFDDYREEIQKLAETAHKAYLESRKAPITMKAGEGFADPDYDLSVEWFKTHQEIQKAQEEHNNGPLTILLISASHRNDHTCPGEISKSSRLFSEAKKFFENQHVKVLTLKLDELNSQYGKKIYPCKACVSTSMPLCHWPCSCYPNHSLGQVQDMMNDIYPLWVKAHGIMIITPVYWHQSPSALKLMLDRLVCADGGNPDPTTTQGKDPELAKMIELKGWDYPRHLKGRCFSVVIHGDTGGADDAKNTLTTMLEEMELISAGNNATLARYIGYYEPYATSHQALDKDHALFEEVRNAAHSLLLTINAQRMHKLESLIPDLHDPHPK